MGIFPKFRGEHQKYLKPPPRKCHSRLFEEERYSLPEINKEPLKIGGLGDELSLKNGWKMV